MTCRPLLLLLPLLFLLPNRGAAAVVESEAARLDSVAQYTVAFFPSSGDTIDTLFVVIPNYAADGLIVYSHHPAVRYGYRVLRDADFAPFGEGSFRGACSHLSFVDLPAGVYLLLLYEGSEKPVCYQLAKAYAPACGRGHRR